MKYRFKINLKTQFDATRFSIITSQLDGNIILTDDDGMCVNAKSTLGALYATEFDTVYCASDNDISTAIDSFIVED